MRRFAPVSIVMLAALTPSVFSSGCTHTCDASAVPSEAYVELPAGWVVSQLCLDSTCAQSRTLEMEGEPGTRPYRLEVVDPDGAVKAFDGVLTTYVAPAGRSCSGPGLQGGITVRDDGSVTAS
jgi:hypothetical protein